YVDGLAGDEPAAVADQEQAGCGDFVDLPLPPERDAGSVRRTIAIPFGIVAPGVDAARGDDIDPDVVRREFRGKPPRQTDQRHLDCREVSATAAATGIGSVANEAQDVAVFVLDHRAYERARKVESAVKDNIADVLPILVGQFAERHVRADRRVVDEDVNVAEFG